MSELKKIIRDEAGRRLEASRKGIGARAAWEAHEMTNAQCSMTNDQGSMSRAEFERQEDERRDICSRVGLCLCCGERKRIPTHWHVCLECHQGLESER